MNIKKGSILDVFKKAYKHEQHMTASLNELSDMAVKEKDHATYNLLQWYVNEQVEEEAPMMSEEPVKEAKKVVESTVKETYFAEIEKLKAENEELKAKLTELSKVEEVKEEVKDVELSEEPKPITHNPENKVEKEIVRFGKGKDRLSSILEKVYK